MVSNILALVKSPVKYEMKVNEPHSPVIHCTSYMWWFLLFQSMGKILKWRPLSSSFLWCSSLGLSDWSVKSIQGFFLKCCQCFVFLSKLSGFLIIIADPGPWWTAHAYIISKSCPQWSMLSYIILLLYKMVSDFSLWMKLFKSQAVYEQCFQKSFHPIVLDITSNFSVKFLSCWSFELYYLHVVEVRNCCIPLSFC